MPKSVDEVWCISIDILQDVIERQHLNVWIKPIKPMEMNENVLVVLLPDQIFYDHIEAHYAGQLKQALQRVIGEDARLEYRIKADSDTDYCKSTEFLHVAPAHEALKTGPRLNLDYTFETFITGKNNLHARLAAAAVAKAPGDAACDPLLIYGKPGLGKAHLAFQNRSIHTLSSALPLPSIDILISSCSR
jgi:chromosomal replication initiator protein